ncbi:hypothetical protein Mpsy_2271 [Methanolobus psychrophilus R15]|nr:hypothetical protein Mpsy_2271 [Methanolobus psychrophilus R15]
MQAKSKVMPPKPSTKYPHKVNINHSNGPTEKPPPSAISIRGFIYYLSNIAKFIYLPLFV